MSSVLKALLCRQSFGKHWRALPSGMPLCAMKVNETCSPVKQVKCESWGVVLKCRWHVTKGGTEGLKRRPYRSSKQQLLWAYWTTGLRLPLGKRQRRGLQLQFIRTQAYHLLSSTVVAQAEQEAHLLQETRHSISQRSGRLSRRPLGSYWWASFGLHLSVYNKHKFRFKIRTAAKRGADFEV